VLFRSDHDSSLWKTVRRHIALTGKALERIGEPTDEQNADLLKTRATTLARVPKEEGDVGPHIHVVAFRLAREKYAIESCYVREVQAMPRLTPLPFTPSFVLGVTGLHGWIVSVIDLREFFNLPRIALGDPKELLVLETENMRFGVPVDALLGTPGIPVARLQESVHTITDARENYLRGVTPERLIVLDGRRLLTDEKIVVTDSVPRETRKSGGN
jgi:purine-binding chemotaxis protein CheW